MSMTQTKVKRQDLFHLSEIYLLAEATEAKTLFGLPDQKIYSLMDYHYLDKAKEAILEKGILDDSDQFTKAGFLVTRAVQEYASSKTYLRMNNLMIATSQIEPENLIVLTEVVPQEYYQIKVIQKMAFLKELFESTSLVRREPLEDEKDFLLKKIRNRERRQFKENEPTENLLYLEFFDIMEVDIEVPHTSWLYFLEEGKLYTIDIQEEAYYRVSQYYFMKQLFDWLKLPLTPKERAEES